MANTGTIDYIKNNYVTPKVRVKWAFTAKPDDKFGPPQYKVEFWYDKDDAEQKAFVKELLAAENAYRAEKGKGAIKRPSALREDKDDPSKLFFRAACKPKTHPVTGDRVPLPIVDAKAQPCEKIPVFRDDLVRVACTWGGWDSQFGTGIKLYLNSVQLLESNYNGGGNVNPFSEEEGFTAGDSYEGSEEPAGTEEPPFEAEEADVL